MSQSPSPHGDIAATDDLPVRPLHTWWQGPRIWLAAILWVIAVYAICIQWYGRFMGATISGPYWVMSALPLLMLGMAVFLIVGGPLAAIIHIDRTLPFMNVSWHLMVVSILGSALSCLLGLSLGAVSLAHVDSLPYGEKVYHLAVIYPFSDNYFAVFECGRLGFWCKRIYLSRQYYQSVARFRPDPVSGRPAVEICGEWGLSDFCKYKFVLPDRETQ